MNKRHMIVTERYPKILAIHSLICSVVASLSRATDSNNDHNNYSGCLFQNTSKNQFFQNHLHLIFNDPIRYQFLSTVTTCAQSQLVVCFKWIADHKNHKGFKDRVDSYTQYYKTIKFYISKKFHIFQI